MSRKSAETTGFREVK